jgi:galactose mutarotase-like enzyme
MSRRLEVKNEFLAVSVMPDAGGHIAELIDLRTGRNWLWSNPAIPITEQRTAEDYGRELDSGGWDEILFSIKPFTLTTSDGVQQAIPDHGDLIRRRWAVHDWHEGDRVLSMSVSGDTLDYRFSRVITLAENSPRIVIDYSFANNGDFAWPLYWCAHALLDVDADTTIRVDGSPPYRVEGPIDQFPGGEPVPHWPLLRDRNARTVDLSQCFSDSKDDTAFACKLFVKTPDSGRVSVHHSTGHESLTMNVDGAVLPWLGLWVNNGGWSGCDAEPYRNLGLEPSTAAYDSVGEAIDSNGIPWIQPGETRRWKLNLELTA